MQSVYDFFMLLYSKCVELFILFVSLIVSIIGKLGYAGIIVGMTLESSFVPFPSEVVIPPAGYLTVKGDMNILLVILSGIFGSILGSSINYFLAHKYGRRFLEKYAKYLFLTPEKLAKMDDYFRKHGEITTLVGRLIPVVRQYISFPAGLAKMNFKKFIFFTALGASVWVTVLALVGRAVGNNIDLVYQHLGVITKILLPSLVVLVVVYVIYHRRAKKTCAN